MDGGRTRRADGDPAGAVATAVGHARKQPACKPHSLHRLGRMRKRREFLAAAGSRRKFVAPGFVLQVRERPEGQVRERPEGQVRERPEGGARQRPAAAPAEPSVRLGLTATRKIGGAVVRNRARRRLREAARLVLPDHAAPGFDYVLIARADTLRRPFADLRADLETALRRTKCWRARPAAEPDDR